jgi:hypothetical protein
MTTKKKLIVIGVAIALLTLISVWNPSNMIGKFLRSEVVTPTPPTINFTVRKASGDV